MRSILVLLAAQTAPQPVVAPQPLAPVAISPALRAWNPAADYITVGQDEPGYRAWYGATALHAIQVKAFNDYLTTYEVAGIVPTWQLLRTASSWQRCGAKPFEVPPLAEWPHIVQTLRYVRDYVIPTVGPVEPVSGYRNPLLNACAGGAPESAHKHYSAVDLVPLKPITREALMRRLCGIHGRRGLDYGVGLGFYAFLRFHVDTTKYRRWNMDPAVANECPPIVRPTDLATVAQPQSPQPAASASPSPDAQSPVTKPAAAPTAVPAGGLPAPERGNPQQR